MLQPTPHKKKNVRKKKERKGSVSYGTSKLEKYFFDNYLSRYGFDVVYEYEAQDIKRFYDFAIVATLREAEKVYVEKEGITALAQHSQYVRPLAIIEVDGDYYHANPNTTKRRLTEMQKKNKVVDKIKDAWCAKNGIPIFRIWESDIRNNSPRVFEIMGVIRDVVQRRTTKPSKA